MVTVVERDRAEKEKCKKSGQKGRGSSCGLVADRKSHHFSPCSEPLVTHIL